MSFFSVHGQSYEAKYKMVYGTGPKKEISDTLTSIEELFKSLPIKIVIIYTVTTDGNYLLLNGKQEESLSTIGVSILSLIHISEPTRLLSISYAVFCLKKK